MNGANVSQLEDLSAEMLIEIFRYFSARELYLSFARLNIRLDSILKSFCNLFLETACHWDPLFVFFDSFNTVQIYCSDFDSSTLSQYNFSSFRGVRSFSILQSIYSGKYIEPIEQLEKFICPDLCPYLQSLQLPYCSQTLADWIFTGAFPQLRILHLYAIKNQKLVFPLSSINTLHALRQLTIQHENGDGLEKILLLCPNLSYLDFSCDSQLPPFVHVKTPYVSLKRLRLSQLQDFFFHNGQFDLLLSLFPNLTNFYLTVEQYRLHNETIHFVQIGQCLHHRLSRLHSLELIIYVPLHNRSSLSQYNSNKISQMHPLFKYSRRTKQLLHIASFDFTAT